MPSDDDYRPLTPQEIAEVRQLLAERRANHEMLEMITSGDFGAINRKRDADA